MAELLDSGCDDLLLVDILGKGYAPRHIVGGLALVRRQNLPVSIFVTGYTECASYTLENAKVLVKPVPDEARFLQRWS